MRRFHIGAILMIVPLMQAGCIFSAQTPVPSKPIAEQGRRVMVDAKVGPRHTIRIAAVELRNTSVPNQQKAFALCRVEGSTPVCVPADEFDTNPADVEVTGKMTNEIVMIPRRLENVFGQSSAMPPRATFDECWVIRMSDSQLRSIGWRGEATYRGE